MNGLGLRESSLDQERGINSFSVPHSGQTKIPCPLKAGSANSQEREILQCCDSRDNLKIRYSG